MNKKTYDYSVTVAGNFKPNPERDGLELLDEKLGMVPVKYMFRRNPGLKANQAFTEIWDLRGPVWLYFCMMSVIRCPKWGESGFKRNGSCRDIRPAPFADFFLNN